MLTARSFQMRRAARRNHQAVTTGQAKSGPIIAAAASIMILVFGSFLLGGLWILQEIGFGLGFAVLVDALVIRGLLVPAIMHLIARPTGPSLAGLTGSCRAWPSKPASRTRYRDYTTENLE